MRFAFAFLLLFAAPFCAAQTAVYNINTIAGSNWVGDNGPATAAILAQAEGIAFDGSGNMYVADAGNHRVRKITHAGTITTVAGTGIPGFSGDGGPASSAQLNAPYGLMFDGSGNLLIADLGNARVRRVTTDGNIATAAGGGSLTPGGVDEGIAATMVVLMAPRNLASDGAGGFYVSDFGGNCVFRVAADGLLTTAAGTGIPGYWGDGGFATHADLANPAGLVVDRSGSLYIADSGNHAVRKVTNGIISTVAEAATPTGLAVDVFGTLYVADSSAAEILAISSGNQTNALSFPATDLAFGIDGYLYATSATLVRRISFTAGSPVIAGGGNLAYGDGGAASGALLNHPSSVAADSIGNLYIADRDNNRIRRVAPDGTISTVAGTEAQGNDGDFGPAIQATLNAPSAITLDPLGNLYIVDSGNKRIRYMAPSGILYPMNVAGLTSPSYAIGDSYGNVFVSDAGNGTIFKIASNGAVTTLITKLQSPRGLALDSSGNLYFVETAGKRVRRLSPTGNLASYADGTWIAPSGIALGSSGDFFVADSDLNAIVHVDALGSPAAIAGTGVAGFSGDGGLAASSQLNSPSDICINAKGSLEVADLANNRIRQLAIQAAVIPPTVTILNAASLQPGPIAPGMLVNIVGTGVTNSDLPNAQVMFGSIAASILQINSSGLLVEAPEQIANLSAVTVQVLANGNVTSQTVVSVVPSTPALFTDPTGSAAALNQDGTLNSASNPASLGSVVALYGTGEGIGGLPVNVTVGGYPAQILYSGAVVGYPGLWQINVVLPAGYIQSGSLNVIATVGAAATQGSVTISVE